MRMHSWLVGIFSYLIAATAMQADPTTDYLAARDQYIATFKNLPEKDQDGPQAKQSKAHIEQLLTRAVLPWSAPGFPPKGRVHLNCYDDDAMGFSVVNGMEYTTRTATVFVSNRALVMDWLRKNKKISSAQTQPVFPAAFSDESLWTDAMSCDAAATLHKMIKVSPPAGADNTTVALASFSNGEDYNVTPDTLVAAVVRGDRVFIARTSLTVALKPAPHCYRKLLKLENEWPSEQKNGPAIWTSAVKDYHTCFDQHLQHRPVYAKVVKQAEALVNILH